MQCPDCGGSHETNVDPEYLDFLNEGDSDQRATKVGTLKYFARLFDTLSKDKVIKNRAIFLDVPNFGVEYTVEKPGEGYLMVQVGRKQFYANSFMRLTMEFYNEMEYLKHMHLSSKSNLTNLIEIAKKGKEEVKKNVDGIVKRKRSKKLKE